MKSEEAGLLLLEEIFKIRKVECSDELNLRIHRGLSWLKKAFDLQDDPDLQFVSLWICFNAIYAEDLPISQDKQSLRTFLQRVCQVDKDGKIYHIIWDRFSQKIRALLDNPFIYQGFWDYQNQKISQIECHDGLEREKKKVYLALENKDSVSILLVVFNRLYTLRNQIVHGGATYNSSVNRKQLENGAQILTFLLPAFIQIIIENSKHLDLGKPYYPVVQVH